MSDRTIEATGCFAIGCLALLLAPFAVLFGVGLAIGWYIVEALTL